ncbi:uncharacterized protein BP5553_06832 [Venustampulla echinocandica]|uniref:Uncharacterized protein n=1 Tax=Venustampulla echinocandica TaxID=2656787 RepID=A0A370TL12_9HELO|nr:uncharacterized protein BP5553_06832 [Venustampulla echinocandica]RDL36220.1 hypothetical protein BP5553_06832 [Venustampulla echinocandica]
MSIHADVADEGIIMVEKNELHTKYATPRRLSQVLKDLLGDSAEFQVEMRHNVYNIKSSKPLDVVRPALSKQ